MPPKGARKVDSAFRVSSASGKQGDATVVAPKKVHIWPEWSEADINAEKWEGAHKGKEKDKGGKSPVVQHYFEDPEGRIELPHTLRVTHWKRPHEFILDKAPTVVDVDEGQGDFDLFTKNETCCESELIRYIISEIIALWKATEVKAPLEATSEGSPAVTSAMPEELVHEWRPWEHIYALTKVGKGPNIPMYNAHGKYVVKLWYMGCWRKIVVDDTIPFDEEDRMLLPGTMLQHEIWPAILTKALIRVASVDYSGGNSACEFGDFSVIHCLMGWIPEVIHLQQRTPEDVWKLLTRVLPNFKLPEPEKEKVEIPVKPDSAGESTAAMDEGDVGGQGKEKDKPAKPDKADSKMGKAKDKGGKESKAAKDKGPQGVKPVDEACLPDRPETVVFASFSGAPKIPARTLALTEMSETSEQLRQNSISYLYPHPVWVKQSRDCPMERPPPPEVVPKWKLIRPRKPKEIPSAEPKSGPEPPKPIQVLEISSPFLNYKVSPVPITISDLCRPKSGVLERGGTRPGTSLAGESIDETEEEEVPASPSKSVKEVNYTLPQPIVPPKRRHSRSKEGDKDKSHTHHGSSSAKSSIASSKAKSVKPKKDDHAKPQKVEVVKKVDRNDSARTAKSEKVVKLATKPEVAGESDSVVPVIPAAEEGGFSEVPPPEDGALHDLEPAVKDMWMDFDAFSHCFKNVVIYHKPHTYPAKVFQPAELKPATSAARDEKSNHVLYNDSPPQYLFVDNVKESEIIVSLTALSHWPEPAPVVSAPSVASAGLTKPQAPKTPDMKEKSDLAPPSEVTAPSAGPPLVEEPPREKINLVSGSLVAEPHSWKSVAIHKPVLRIKTTATKASALLLPPGRHVLKFTVSAPLAYQLTLCSCAKFQFGSEEDIMPCLTAESCRFVEYATETMNKLGKCFLSFSDEASFPKSMTEFVEWHCPYWQESDLSKKHHFKIFNDALYSTFKKSFNAEFLTPEIAFAIRSVLFDATTPNILGLTAVSRPPTGLSASHRSSAKAGKTGGKSRTNLEVEKTPDNWVDREPTVDEMVAQVKLSKAWRGYYVRKIVQARMCGSKENQKVSETLAKLWAYMEPHANTQGLHLYKVLFRSDMNIMEKYPFHADEWSKILYFDYAGTYPEQPPGMWFVVFREVFYIQEKTFCVPKLYAPNLSTCLLRVINNDTGEEMPKVFQRVAPAWYSRNRKGYTFVAEARSTDRPVLPGKVTVRLIGSHTPLPVPAKPEVNSVFVTKEIQDYYVPQPSKVLMRYNLKVHEDSHLASIQLQTSKSDVYVKLQILDRGEEVISAEGKGHVVLPAVIFHSDTASSAGADLSRERRPSSRGSQRGGSKSAKKKDRTAPNPNLEATSPQPTHASSTDLTEDGPAHKYTIQALVLRDSWPFNQIQWAFANELREQEKNELRVQKKEGDAATAKDKGAAAAAAAPSKGAKGKGKEMKSGKEKSSRPASVQFDASKPHWLLRFVSDGAAQPPEPVTLPTKGGKVTRISETNPVFESVDDVEITKDTDRADEIRAIKRAWEEADPGRAAKAYQSRLKYLNSHMVKNPDAPAASLSEGESTERASPELDESDMTYTLEPPTPPPPKEILPPIDVTPFLRKLCDQTRYFDDEEQLRQQNVRMNEFQEYNKFRQKVEKWREDNLLERNQQKVAQLELFEKMQALVDEGRAALNEPREAFRQKYLEAERQKLEELAAQEAAMKTQTEKVASPKGKRSAKGKSAKKK